MRAQRRPIADVLTRIVLTAALVCAAPRSWSAATEYRSGRSFRGIATDVYEIGIQKSGRLDVSLISGELIFSNVCPMVWLEGDEGPRPLALDGRAGARQEVRDRLGQGHGMLFTKGDCLWSIRAYITKPYFAAQVTFVNTKRKPVKVSMLLPWCVGDRRPGIFSLGPGTEQALVLDNGRTWGAGEEAAQLASGTMQSLWNVAVYNPGSQRSLVAGAVTSTRAYTQFRIGRGTKAPASVFDTFMAQCVYDPPIEVPPGGKLASELLYFSVGETSPLVGLERYGAALAAASGITRKRPQVPYGWDSWSGPQGTDITEAGVLETLDVIDRRLKRYGWTRLTVGPGWERAPGDWEPDPERFPHGMKWLADQIHARGMTAGLWINPFIAGRDTPVVQTHPEWLVRSDTLDGASLPSDCSILDVTAPGVTDYVQTVCAKVAGEWGYDVLVETDLAYPFLWAESFRHPALTRIDAIRLGLQAVRQGLGRERALVAGGPLPITAGFVDVADVGAACAPIWRASADRRPWGCVEALTNAARRYYLSAALFTPDPGCAFFGHASTRERWQVTDAPELTWNQRIAWLTGAALTGGALRIGDRFSELNDAELAVLAKLLPPAPRPARPVDLFERDMPCIWSLPLATPAGEWHIVGVFNWDEQSPQTVSLEFASLGLDAGAYYTVYDFWDDTYFGTARWRLDVGVPPGSVRLLGLRRYENRPMFLASDRNFTQGASDHRSLTWDSAARRLTGVFAGVPDTGYNLRLLVPEGFTVNEAHVSTGESSVTQDGLVLKLSFHCAEQGDVEWSVDFHR